MPFEVLTYMYMVCISAMTPGGINVVSLSYLPYAYVGSIGDADEIEILFIYIAARLWMMRRGGCPP